MRAANQNPDPGCSANHNPAKEQPVIVEQKHKRHFVAGFPTPTFIPPVIFIYQTTKQLQCEGVSSPLVYALVYTVHCAKNKLNICIDNQACRGGSSRSQ